MGTLRTLLALTVVLAHCHGFVFVGGQLAVQLFYLISGFLMSFVLVEQNTYPSAKRFYFARALRIYPAYLTVAAATLGFVWLTGGMRGSQSQPLLEFYAGAPASALAVVGLTNVTLLGQDWLLFAGVQEGTLQLTGDYAQSDWRLFQGQLVPQAWTLGLELSFYLLAPFLLRRPVWLWGAFLGSLAVRGWLLADGRGFTDPWTYRFFPAELATFLAGALSHRYLAPRWNAKGRARASTVIAVAIIGAVIAYAEIAIAPLVKGPLIALAVCLALPALLNFQNRHRWDRRLGELSYPLYLVHLLVIAAVDFTLARTGGASLETRLVLCVAGSLAAAWALNEAVCRAVEKRRQHLREQPTIAQPPRRQSSGMTPLLR